MTKEQAINLLDQAVQQLRLTRQDHALLQQALTVLQEEEPKNEKSE